MISAIARAARELFPEAAIHEQRDDEEHDGHRNLSAHEDGAPPPAAAARRDAVGRFHDRGEIGTRGLNRRNEPEQHRAHHRHEEAEHERAAIHPERERDGEIRRNLDLPEQQPVFLTSSQDNPNGATVRFLLDGAQLADVTSYARVVYVFDGRDASAVERAREEWRRVKAAGCEVTYWQQSPEGRWEKKA